MEGCRIVAANSIKLVIDRTFEMLGMIGERLEKGTTTKLSKKVKK